MTFRLARRLLAGLLVVLLAGPAMARSAPATTLTPAGDMVLGDPKARIQVVEYASLTCPHCAAFNSDVFPAFRKKYVDTGKASYTLKEMLTSPAEVAAAGYLTARCVGRQNYFAAVDDIFRAQPRLFGEEGPRAVLLGVAAKYGLSEEQFNACIRDRDALQKIYERAIRAGEQDGVEGTPTLVINGQRLPAGELSFAQLEDAIAQAGKGAR